MQDTAPFATDLPASSDPVSERARDPVSDPLARATNKADTPKIDFHAQHLVYHQYPDHPFPGPHLTIYNSSILIFLFPVLSSATSLILTLTFSNNSTFTSLDPLTLST